MAHQIDFSIGRAAMASTQKEWHFGETKHEIILPTDSIDDIVRKSGMEYNIQRAFVQYATERAGKADRKVDDRVVLFRSDTMAPLGIVSVDYAVDQPRDQIAFFHKWVQEGGVTLESAAALYDGKRYFACARIGEAIQIGKGDWVLPYVVYANSCDGTIARRVYWTSVRVVCDNTLQMSLSSHAGMFKQTHRSKFKANEARAQIEAANQEFGAFCQAARALTQVRVDSAKAHELTTNLFEVDWDALKAKAKEEKKPVKAPNGYDRVMALFGGEAKGSGLPGVMGTGWGWLNSVTQYVDHEIRARSDEHRFVSSQDGAGLKIKERAIELVQA
jgi:phage/plasmid-like protein (TIGR03299 family)